MATETDAVPSTAERRGWLGYPSSASESFSATATIDDGDQSVIALAAVAQRM